MKTGESTTRESAANRRPTAQSKSRSTAPPRRMKTDHGSTAPKASTENMRSARLPESTARSQRRPGSGTNRMSRLAIGGHHKRKTAFHLVLESGLKREF